MLQAQECREREGGGRGLFFPDPLSKTVHFLLDTRCYRSSQSTMERLNLQSLLRNIYIDEYIYIYFV